LPYTEDDLQPLVPSSSTNDNDNKPLESPTSDTNDNEQLIPNLPYTSIIGEGTLTIPGKFTTQVDRDDIFPPSGDFEHTYRLYVHQSGRAALFTDANWSARTFRFVGTISKKINLNDLK